MRYVRDMALVISLGMASLSWGPAAKAAPRRLAPRGAHQESLAGESQDGTWWGGLDQDSKLFFVYGYVAGINYASDQTDIFQASSNKDVAKAAAVMQSMILIAPGATVGQLVEGTNAFYADYRNTRVKVRQALGVVGDNISGEDPAVVQAYVRYLRCDAIYGGDGCKGQESAWIKALGASMPGPH